MVKQVVYGSQPGGAVGTLWLQASPACVYLREDPERDLFEGYVLDGALLGLVCRGFWLERLLEAHFTGHTYRLARTVWYAPVELDVGSLDWRARHDLPMLVVNTYEDGSVYVQPILSVHAVHAVLSWKSGLEAYLDFYSAPGSRSYGGWVPVSDRLALLEREPTDAQRLMTLDRARDRDG